MEEQKCHCNGSRGTDCDWCGGSGWITPPVRLNITPLDNFQQIENNKQANSINSVFNDNIKPEKKSSDGKRKQAKLTNSSTNNYTKAEINSLNKRLYELNMIFKKIDKLSSNQIVDFRKKVYDLNSEIKRLDKKVTKTQRAYYDKVKTKSDILFINTGDKLKVNKHTQFDKTNVISKKKTETNMIKTQQNKKPNKVTLVSKFKDLFETVKQRLNK